MIKETHQSLIIAIREIIMAQYAECARHSAIIVPMLGRHELIGFLILIHEQTGYFNLEHQLLLQAIAGQAAIAVENVQLYASIAKEQLRLTAILQSAADAILVFDADSCLSLLNPAGEKLFTDYDAKLGLPLARGCGYDSLIELLEEACTSSKPMTGEFVSPDRRAFSVLLTPIEEGGYVVVLHDVTHFKNFKELRMNLSPLPHTTKKTHRFNKRISHLERCSPLNDMQNDLLQRIQNAVENMSEMVEKFWI